jgi:endonuclease/exonuclease/phosphatase family metal-dependent hydrolase
LRPEFGVRVLTWNIWNGGLGRLDAIERVLREQDADLVALQEATDRAAVAALGARLGMEVVYGEANSEFAVAWLSRLTVAGAQNHRLPQLEKTLLEIEVEDRRLFATHLSAGRTRADEPRRVAEVEAILQHVGEGDVLVGDFNAVHPDDEVGAPPPEQQEPANYVSRRPIEFVLEAGFTDCFRALNPDQRGWTYLAWHPWARLDYVFARQRAPACTVVETQASDHFAVVAELD